MAFTQITTSNLDNTINTKLAAAEAANAAVANIVSLAISSVQIADSSYNVIDDTAANTGGGYLVINGTGFTNQCVVIVGTTNATSTTFANTKQLRAQVPGLAAATYPLYVVDSVTGATAIKVNGLTYSSFPAWSTGSTLSNQSANTSFSVNLSATSDSSVTYANTTALPAGTTLAANGLFSGTVTIGAQTTYSFDVKATDAENQDVSRTFSLTVTVGPAPGLYLVGYSYYGSGFNDRVYRSSPTQLGGSTWSVLSPNLSYNISVIKSDGTLWAWGRNSHGQLGLNDIVDRSSPTQVGTNTNWSKTSSMGYNTFGIKTDGTLWACGAIFYGMSGHNNSIYRSSPTQVGTGTNWAEISVGDGFAMAIKTDGTLWGWGRAAINSFGNGNSTDKSSPTQVGAGTTWSKIATRAYGGVALKTDGTLWSWGTNQNGGAVGNNTSYPASDSITQTQIGTGTSWNSISAGNFSVMATKTDGTLWTWGSNSSGQLGVNNTVDRSSPTQVGTGTNWSTTISCGGTGMAAIKTDGTLWTWGNGSVGALGLNSGVNQSSPTQVGTGTTWSKVSKGSLNLAAIIT